MSVLLALLLVVAGGESALALLLVVPTICVHVSSAPGVVKSTVTFPLSKAFVSASLTDSIAIGGM